MSATDPAAPQGEARPADGAALRRAWERFDLVAIVALAALAYRGVAMSEPLHSTISAAERFFFHPTQNAPDMTLIAMVGLLLADWRRLSGRVGRAPASA